MKLKIGNVTLENNLILAPMAGVTDLPFRILCKEQGCGMVVTEMVSAKAILYKNRNTKALLEVEERERPVSVQLFGSDPEIMADIAKLIEPGPFDIIDVNMGCPVPKIVNNGDDEESQAGGGGSWRHGEGCKKACDSEVPQGFYGQRCERGGICQDGRELRRGCGCGSRQDEGTVLFRGRRLGYYSQGKRSREDTGHWKWRRLCPRGCEGAAGRDGLRWNYDCERGKGQPVDLLENALLPGDGGTSSAPIHGGAAEHGSAPCEDVGGTQRRVSGNPGDAQAHGLVYGRTASFGKTAE